MVITLLSGLVAFSLLGLAAFFASWLDLGSVPTKPWLAIFLALCAGVGLSMVWDLLTRNEP